MKVDAEEGETQSSRHSRREKKNSSKQLHDRVLIDVEQLLVERTIMNNFIHLERQHTIIQNNINKNKTEQTEQKKEAEQRAQYDENDDDDDDGRNCQVAHNKAATS